MCAGEVNVLCFGRIFLFLPSQLYQCLTNKIYLSDILLANVVGHSQALREILEIYKDV